MIIGCQVNSKKYIITLVIVIVVILQILGLDMEIKDSFVPNDAKFVISRDSLIYVIAGLNCMIYSINDTINPVFLHRHFWGKEYSQILFVDNYMYCRDKTSGLYIYEHPDIYTFTLIDSIPLFYPFTDMLIVKNTLYTGGSQLCHGYDISNPAHPTLESSLHGFLSESEYLSCDTLRNLLFVSDFTGGISIYNITSPQNPIKLSEYDNGGVYCKTIYEDNLLYVPGTSAGVEVIDVSNPYSPYQRTMYYTGESVTNMCKRGDYLAVPANEKGLYTIDISNPDSLFIVDTVAHAGYINNFHQLNDYVMGTCFYNGIFVCSFPPSGIFEEENIVTLFTEMDYVAIQDTLAFINVNRDGYYNDSIKVYNIKNPLNAQYLTTFSTLASYNMILRNDSMFLACSNGLYIYDISDINNPVKLYQYTDNGYVSGLCLYEDYIYTFNTFKGLIIFKRSSSGVEYIAQTNNTGSGIQSLFRIGVCRGDYIYVGCGNNGMVMYDITDREVPKFLGFQYVDFPCQFCLDDSVLVMVGHWGIHRMLLGDSGEVSITTEYDWIGCYDGIMNKNNLILSHEGYGVSVFDIQEDTIAEIGFLRNFKESRGMYNYGDYIFCTHEEQGTRIYNYTNGDILGPSPPMPIYPRKNISVGTDSILFSWKNGFDKSSIDSTLFQISTDTDFSDDSIFSVSDSFVILSLPPSTYFWRVSHVDAAGNTGNWSAPQIFNVSLTGIFQDNSPVGLYLKHDFTTHLFIQTDITRDIECSMFDITGRSVINRSTTIVKGSNIIDLDCVPGVYFFKLKTSDGIIIRKKLIFL